MQFLHGQKQLRFDWSFLTLVQITAISALGLVFFLGLCIINISHITDVFKEF